jgi:5-methylcytosine-specific restriction endonuclease McrA
MRAKIDEQWVEARALWFQLNEPSHEGYYTCALCGRVVHIDEVTLDHVIPRSRDVTLKYDQANLAPMHFACNNEKGSRMIRPAYWSPRGTLQT